MYKLVASDIDGTLNNDNGNLSQENLLAIQKLDEMGIPFVLATGRTLCEMTELLSIPQIRYVVYSNGAAIYDKQTDTSTCMGIYGKTVKDVLKLLFNYECYIVLHHGGNTYEKPFAGYEELKKYNISPIIYNLLKNYGTQPENFEEFALTLDYVESIAVFFANNEDEAHCREILSKDDRLFFAGAWDSSFEVFSIEAGKKKAIQRLLDMLKINVEDLVYLGDSENDVELLKFAGLGLCVANGSENAKNAADKVICTNNENVVEYTLNNILTE